MAVHVVVARRREEVAKLVHVEMLTARQIAERLGVSVATVRQDLAFIQADLRQHADEHLRLSVLQVWTHVHESFRVRIQAYWQDFHDLDPQKLAARDAEVDAAFAAKTDPQPPARAEGDAALGETAVHPLPSRARTYLDVRRHRLNLLTQIGDELDRFAAQAQKLGLMVPFQVPTGEGEVMMTLDELKHWRSEIDDLIQQVAAE